MQGYVRGRGKNTWEVSLELPRNAVTGARRRRTISVKGLRRDADRVLNDAINKRDTGFDLNPHRLTVAQYLEKWLTDDCENRLARSTYHRYRGIFEKHLKPTIGGVRLLDLRPTHIQSAYSQWLRDGLSPSTVLQHHHIIRKALSQAIKWQLLQVNPSTAVTLPKRERLEMRSLYPSEAGQLLATSVGSGLEPLLLLALETGMRQGELLALQWSAVDLRGGDIQVLRSARYYPGDGIVMGPTKTHRSRRHIALASSTTDELKRHKATQNEHRLSLGKAWADNDLVFPGPLGEPYPARDVSRRLSTVVRHAGLEPLRFHDLRHTAATLMLRTGISPKVVSDRLGHSTVAFTLDTYAHVLPDMQKDAAEALSLLLRANVKSI